MGRMAVRPTCLSTRSKAQSDRKGTQCAGFPEADIMPQLTEDVNLTYICSFVVLGGLVLVNLGAEEVES